MAQIEKGFGFSFFVVFSSLSSACQAVAGTHLEVVDNMSPDMFIENYSLSPLTLF